MPNQRNNLRDTALRVIARTRRRTAPADPGLDIRLVNEPVFVLCPTRSGSTLLRLILNTHSQIRAPHELQLNSLRVSPRREGHVDKPMAQMGVTFLDLENMLWDRILYELLVTSGKNIIVDKTPQNSADWQRIHAYWPRARYLHLRRHPAAILQSRISSLEEQPMERHLRLINTWGRQLNASRAALPGLTVRYEDLTTNPQEVMQAICRYLGVAWEPAMLDYDTRRGSEILYGLGDHSETIRAGRVQAARRLPEASEVPDALRTLTEQWGYL